MYVQTTYQCTCIMGAWGKSQRDFIHNDRTRERERHTDFSLRHKSFVVNFLLLSMLVVC